MKIALARQNRLFRFTLICIGLFIVFITAYAVVNPDQMDIDSLVELVGGGVGGGLILGNMAAIGNIDGVNGKQTTGKQLNLKIWLIDVGQIDKTVAYPQPNANREVGTIPLKGGEFMHYFEGIPDSVKDNSTGEGGDITTEVTNVLEITMGGDGVKLYDFIEDHTGGRFVVIYQKCVDGTYYTQGSPCKPMVLQSFDRKRDSEATAVMFTFQNSSFKQPYIYVGAITETTPQVVPADATDLAIVAGKSQYQLTDNTGATVLVTVSGIISGQYGNTIQVLGSGGANPSTIADNTVYILIDGTTWTGNAGSSISFRIQDSGTLVEIAGTRIQT